MEHKANTILLKRHKWDVKPDYDECVNCELRRRFVTGTIKGTLIARGRNTQYFIDGIWQVRHVPACR